MAACEQVGSAEGEFEGKAEVELLIDADLQAFGDW